MCVGGGGQAAYTLLLRTTKGGEGVQKACKNAYVINHMSFAKRSFFNDICLI